MNETEQVMRVEVSYFAAARELAACDREVLQLPRVEADPTAVLDALCLRHPRLAAYRGRMRLAVNGELAEVDAVVRDGDEVAVLPPVAGGSENLCALRDGPLSIDEVFRAVMQPSAGGVALFIGTVRDHAEGRPVARLDYEAHPTLALKEMRRILDAQRAARPEIRVAAVHRTGKLQVGDLAVIVGASAPHRAEAFDACRLLIEEIKDSVPIWKHEWTPDGDAVWVNLEG